MKMMACLLFLFTTLAQADVSPEHVNHMLDQMIKENVISQEEAIKARIRMKAMSPGQWKEINEKAASIANRSPASANIPSNNKIEEVRGVDLDGAQFKQIQDDIKKIVPAYRD